MQFDLLPLSTARASCPFLVSTPVVTVHISGGPVDSATAGSHRVEMFDRPLSGQPLSYQPLSYQPLSYQPLRALRVAGSTAMDLVLPRPCPGCGGPGPWCDGCASTLRVRPRRMRLPDGIPSAAALPPVWALTRYTGPCRAAIIAGKEHGRRELPALLGHALGEGLLRLRRLAALPSEMWLVPAPSKQAAARRRGGDPVRSMASSAARLLASQGVATGVAPCLVTARSARDSVGLDATARAANLVGRVLWDGNGAPPSGAGAVIVDDVLTTGATMSAACIALRSAGVRVDAVLVLASVPGWIGTR